MEILGFEGPVDAIFDKRLQHLILDLIPLYFRHDLRGPRLIIAVQIGVLRREALDAKRLGVHVLFKDILVELQIDVDGILIQPQKAHDDGLPVPLGLGEVLPQQIRELLLVHRIAVISKAAL